MATQWNDARDLISWCLCDNPAHRPQSFEDVLGHAFLRDGGKLHFKTKPCQPREVAVQKAALELHLAIEKDDPETVRKLFEAGSVLYNLCLQGSELTDAQKSITPLATGVAYHAGVGSL
jgi:hypothetical protein